MNDRLAQMVALVCHANAVLRGHDTDIFRPENSTGQFCNRISFVECFEPRIGKAREREVGDSPEAWFRDLRARGAVNVRLTHGAGGDPTLSDRLSGGFTGGGGDWRIEVIWPDGMCEAWIARWEVWNPNAAERRIWCVTYCLVQRGQGKPTQLPELSEIEQQFLQALRAIEAFSERHRCVGFTEAFRNAIETLRRGARHGYHKDLAPKGVLSDQAEAVLDAAQSAWVFGGMGSWNDLRFEVSAQKEYEQISERLFQVLVQTTCAGANSSVADSRSTR